MVEFWWEEGKEEIRFCCETHPRSGQWQISMCEKNNSGARWNTGKGIRLEKQQFRCGIWQIGHETIRDVYLSLRFFTSGKSCENCCSILCYLAPRVGPLKIGNLHIGSLCNEVKLFTPIGRLYMWSHFCCSCYRNN